MPYIIGAVIPHFGDGAKVDALMTAIKAQSHLPDMQMTVHVVDSNPPNQRNLFTSAVNLGIQHALNANASAIWVINDDCIPARDCISCGIGKLISEPRIGIVASRNLHPSDPDRITWGGSGECWPSGRHIVGLVSEGACAVASRQEWVSFASVFLRRDMVLELGMLDPFLQHICSDADYCLRARASNWEVWYEPTSTVMHPFHSSHGAGTPAWMKYIMHLDQKRFGKKYGFSTPDKKPDPNYRRITPEDFGNKTIPPTAAGSAE